MEPVPHWPLPQGEGPVQGLGDAFNPSPPDAQTFARPNQLMMMYAELNNAAAAIQPPLRQRRPRAVQGNLPNNMSVEEIRNQLIALGAPQRPAPNPQQLQASVAAVNAAAQALHAEQAPRREVQPTQNPVEHPNNRELDDQDEVNPPDVIEDNVQNALPDDPSNPEGERDDGHNEIDAVVHRQPNVNFLAARAIGRSHEVIEHNLGSFNVCCTECGALHWIEERLKSSSLRSPKFGKCCMSGKVSLFQYSAPPAELLRLYKGTHRYSKDFFNNIRQYNLTFSMTSLGVDEELTYRGGDGPYCFKIRGQLHHRIGSLLPDSNTDTPKFAQLWILDPQEALGHRQNLNPRLNPNLLMTLNDIIVHAAGNPFIGLYNTAYETFQREGLNNEEYKIKLVINQEVDLRRYNLPTANEIAVLMPLQEGETPSKRDIILRFKGGSLQRISDISPMYLPLYYVLLFPRGELGWSPDIAKVGQEVEVQRQNGDDNNEEEDEGGGENGNNEDTGTSKTPHVTQREYFAYRLHVRRSNEEVLFMARRLFQEYVVDAWATTDQNRLSWIQKNQKDL